MNPAAMPTGRLLTADEPPAYEMVNDDRRSPVLLVCDHASRRLPKQCGSLGLEEPDLSRHIAWDIGAAEVTRYMAMALAAPAILCNYSRLVIDCNRHLRDVMLIPARSGGTAITGNEGLSAAQRQGRIDSIYAPYHGAIRDVLNNARDNRIAPAVLSIHSCTPQINGELRPWHIGICWERDSRLSAPVLERLARRGDIVVGDNQPYALVSDEDYTIPTHAMKRNLRHLQVEFRQDLIDNKAGAEDCAKILLEALAGLLS